MGDFIFDSRKDFFRAMREHFIAEQYRKNLLATFDKIQAEWEQTGDRDVDMTMQKYMDVIGVKNIDLIDEIDTYLNSENVYLGVGRLQNDGVSDANLIYAIINYHGPRFKYADLDKLDEQLADLTADSDKLKASLKNATDLSDDEVNDIKVELRQTHALTSLLMYLEDGEQAEAWFVDAVEQANDINADDY